MGSTFKANFKVISTYVNAMNEKQIHDIKTELEKEGKVKIKIGKEEFELTEKMLTIKLEKKKINGRNFVPHVIEPSYGIGRIVYAILEHAYYVREGDEQRGVLAVVPVIAPVKCSILPLVSNQTLDLKIPAIIRALTNAGISYRVDSTAQKIGRRYARTDEIAIPFAITIDFTTLDNNTVTLRERDSMKQIRISLDSVAQLLVDLVNRKIKWEDVVAKYPAQESNDEDK